VRIERRERGTQCAYEEAKEGPVRFVERSEGKEREGKGRKGDGRGGRCFLKLVKTVLLSDFVSDCRTFCLTADFLSDCLIFVLTV
jgi:hypothetical protein